MKSELEALVLAFDALQEGGPAVQMWIGFSKFIAPDWRTFLPGIPALSTSD